MLRSVLCLCLTLFHAQALLAAPLKTTVSAEGAILINADTGAVLFEYQADKPLYPASVTKMATALYALNRGGIHLDTVITAEGEALTPTTEAAKKRSNYKDPAYWLETDGTHIGLKRGEQMSLHDLLYGIMLASGNDAANVVAQYIAGSVSQYMADVNAYLQELGCTSTHLCNPHGLHHPDHVSTARDLALIAREGLKNPIFREIVATVRHTRPKTNLQEPSTLLQGNLLLRKGPNYYGKAIGIKTGYHSRARHNIAAAARQGDRTLIAVLMQNPDRKEMFKEAVKLFELAFQQPKVERTYLESGPQPFALKLPGSNKAIETFLPESITYSYYPAEEPNMRAVLFWDEKLSLTIKKGQRVGEIRLIAEEGRIVQQIPLFANNDVHPSMLYRLSHAIAGNSRTFWVVVIVVTLAFCGYLLLGRRRVYT